MVDSSHRFVVATKGAVAPQKNAVERDDVGVIVSEEKSCASIFFIRVWRQVELEKNDFEMLDVRRTGDGFAKKICNLCNKLKRTIEFARNQNAKNNRPVRRPSCKDCRITMEGVGISKTDRIEWNKKKPDKEPFECPICEKRSIAGINCKVVLEHDHRTGKPGGWICDSCNTGLGRFKDDVAVLKSAIEFLQRNY